MDVFSGRGHFFRLAAGLFSWCLLRRTKGARMYTTVEIRAPGGVRGACSGPSKSRTLADDYDGQSFRQSFRPGRAEQDNGYPLLVEDFCMLLSAAVSCPIKSTLGLPKEAAKEQEQSFIKICLCDGQHIFVCASVRGP